MGPQEEGPACRSTRTATDIPEGTTSLLATINIATAQVLGKCHPRHRQQEFLEILNEFDARIESAWGRGIHVVLDEGTYETPEVKRWFERRPEAHFGSPRRLRRGRSRWRRSSPRSARSDPSQVGPKPGVAGGNPRTPSP